MNISASTSSSVTSVQIQALETSLMFFNLLLVFPTHACVLKLIVTGSGVAAEFLNLNLCVCEMGTSLSSLSLLLSHFLSGFSFFNGFLTGLSVTARPLFQCLMCVERFLAVVHPVTFLKLKPLRYRIFCCSVAWTITLASCLFCMFALTSFHVEIYAWFLTVQFLSAISIQLFCLVSVLRALRQSGPGERKEESHRKRRAFLIILITTVSMMLLYLPFSAVALFTSVSHQYVYSLWCVALTCFMLGGLAQPLLYLHRAGKLSHARVILLSRK